jgi:hypothetical protein
LGLGSLPPQATKKQQKLPSGSLFCYASAMKKNVGLKPLLIILTIFCMNSFAGSSPNKMPDLTTAKLNLECNSLLESKAAEASFNQGLCVGIILGVEDNAHYDKKICVPNNMNIRDRLIVVKNYVESQPKRMKEAYASLAFDALAQKWPCSPKKS